MAINKKIAQELKKRNKKRDEEDLEEVGFQMPSGKIIYMEEVAPASWMLSITQVTDNPGKLLDAVLAVIKKDSRDVFLTELEDNSSDFKDTQFLLDILTIQSEVYGADVPLDE